jgi:hypothetical protein
LRNLRSQSSEEHVEIGLGVDVSEICGEDGKQQSSNVKEYNIPSKIPYCGPLPATGVLLPVMLYIAVIQAGVIAAPQAARLPLANEEVLSPAGAGLTRGGSLKSSRF